MTHKKLDESWFEFMDRAKSNGVSPTMQESMDKEIKRTDLKDLIALAKDTLNALDKFAAPPHYFVQPGLGIVKKHIEIIKKFNLMEAEE